MARKFYKVYLFILFFIVIILCSCSSNNSNKNDFNVLNISFNNAIYKYDGQEKSIFITGELPSDISVSYSGNNKIDVGEYEVTATFKDENNKYDNISEKKAIMTIIKGDYDMSNVIFSDCYYDYDELPHNSIISLRDGYNLPDEISVTYDGNDKVDIGEYEVIAHFNSTNSNYNFIPDMKAKLVIGKGNYHYVNFHLSNDLIIKKLVKDNDSLIEIPGIIAKEGYKGYWNYDFDCIKEDIDLYPTYIANKYSISYDVNGGDSLDDPIQNVNFGEQFILEEPTRTGYTFAGWYCGDTKIESGIYIFDYNLNLKAIWLANNYTITYNVNGGDELENNTQEVLFGDVNTLSIPTRTGYTFAGWYYNDVLIDDVLPWNIDSNVTLVAKWTNDICSIVYVVNGGNPLEDNVQKVVFDEEYELVIPTRTGYTFAGWYNGDMLYENGIWTYSNTLVLTALWIPNMYSIIYDVNGGDSLSNNIQLVLFGSNYYLATPTRIGYTFNGWNYNNELFEDGIWNFDNHILLNASWEANKYTITYDVNGGDELVTSTQEVIYDSLCILKEPTRTGYTFTGWYLDTTKVENGTWTTANDVTLKANWEANKYTITYDVNGGDELVTSTQEVIYDSLCTLKEPTRTGYTFTGWYLDTTKVEDGTWTIANDVTLKTSWELTVYKIEVINKKQVFCEYESYYGTKYGDLIELPIDTSPNLGYEFVGWFDQDDVEYSEDLIINKDLTITAKYEIVCYELPVIVINTENGSPIQDRETYISSKVSMFNTAEEYCFEEIDAGVRGRGSSSWSFPKKSYRIKFDKKQSMMGSEYKAKSWTLIANYNDLTLSRNATAYELSKYFSGIEFTTIHEFVEVFLNDEYLGVYLLCDQMQTGDGRVDIDEDLSDVNNISFFIERDARAPGEGILNQDYVIFNKLEYAIKTPDTESQSFLANKDKYVESITNYLSLCVEAILSKDYDKICEYIDINSFAEVYIIEELFANNDYGYSSTYYYKDKTGKLMSGPIWDFDIGAGNINYNVGNVDECLPNSRLWVNTSSYWNKLLMNNCQEFKDLISKKINEYEDTIISIIERLNVNNTVNIYSLNKKSFDRNFDRWKILGVRLWPQPKSVYELTTINEHFEYLYNWLMSRLKYMEECYSVVTSDSSDSAYRIDFLEDRNSSVVIYNTNNYDEGINSIVGWSGDGTTGALLKDGTGQINFKFDLKDGYEIDQIIIYGDYKNLKTPADTLVEGLYRITKISSDLIVVIKTKLAEEEPDPVDPPSVDGYKGTFIIEHGKIMVYNTQDYTVEGNELLEAVSRDSSTGLPDETGEGQINFKVVLDDGYKIDNIEITPNNYKNLKVVDADNNIYRITKITGDINIIVNVVSL